MNDACRCIRANETADAESAGIKDAEVRRLLVDVLQRQGKQLEADCVLLSISFSGLREKDPLPP